MKTPMVWCGNTSERNASLTPSHIRRLTSLCTDSIIDLEKTLGYRTSHEVFFNTQNNLTGVALES